MIQTASSASDTTVAVLHTGTVQPAAEPMERAMLAEDKLPVVLAVVLIVWAGLLLVVFRTDRRLTRVERRLADAEESAASYLSSRS